MANLGEGPGPLFLDQTEAEGPKKLFLETGLPRLSKGLDDRPLPRHPSPLISRSGSGTDF